MAAVRGDGGGAVTAELTDGKGVVRKARYDSLKPVAAQRPVRQVNKPQSVSKGVFVLLKDDDGFVLAGVVTGCSETVLTVHLHEGNDTGVSWLPLWEDGDRIFRRKASVADETAHLAQLVESNVQVVGEITQTFRLRPSTMKAAKSQCLL